MKKVLFIVASIFLIFNVVEAKTWQDYDLFTTPADGDHLLVNDVSDLTDNAAGTIKRLAWLYVQPRDYDLTAIATEYTTAYGRALLALANEAALKALITTPWTVPYGGTGAAFLTDGGVLLGSGTGAVTPMAVLLDGQMIVGDGTTDPVAESGATLRTSIGVGSSDAVTFTTVNTGQGANELYDMDQNVLTTSNVTVNSITATGTGTSGTATGGSSTTMVDNTAPFVADEYNGYKIRNTTKGAGSVCEALITDGTTTTLTHTALPTACTGADTFENTNTYTIVSNGGRYNDGFPNTDDTCEGEMDTVTAGTTILYSQAVVVDPVDGHWILSDANAEATKMRAVACSNAADGEQMDIMYRGSIRHNLWNWTINDDMFLSTTAGTIGTTKPSGTGDIVQHVGFAIYADVLRIDISHTYNKLE